MKKVLICILVILLFIPQVLAEESELEQAIQNIKEKYQIVDEAQTRFLEAQKQIEELSSKIQEQTQLVEEAQQQLEEFNQSLKEQEDILKKRIRQIYMIGPERYNMIMFSKTTLADILNLKSGIENIQEADSKLIKLILTTRKEKNETIKVLSQLKRGQQSLLNKKTLILIKDKVQYQTQKALCARELNAFDELAQKYGKRARDYHFDVNLMWPVDGVYLITSSYGWRQTSFLGSDFHTGIDIGASYGMPVRTVSDGVIEFSGWQGYGGNCIIINHGTDNDGVVISSLYAHLSTIAVQSGQVSKGDIIGYVGSTGLSTGPHLHLEIMENGNHTNPLNYFN